MVLSSLPKVQHSAGPLHFFPSILPLTSTDI